MYFGKYTPKDQSTAYGPGDLGLGRALPLSKLIADYQGHAGTTVDWVPDYPGAGTLSEAHVFIEDPQQTWDDLFKINMSGNPSHAFSQLVSGRAGGIGIVWPRWHGLTAPGGSRSSAQLNCLEFYPSVSADTGTIVGCTVHHVEALRVNDRGGCATKTEMPAREFAQSVWCGFKDAVEGFGSKIFGSPFDIGQPVDAKRHANKVASALIHPAGAAASNAGGGFASYADFEVYYADAPFGEPTVTRIYLVYGYPFTLDNGILALGGLRWNGHYSGLAAPYNDLIDKLQHHARKTFRDSAQLSQAVPIPVSVPCPTPDDPTATCPEPVGCNPGQGDVAYQCRSAVDLLSAGLLNAQIQHLISTDEYNKLLPVIKDKANWTCQADDVSGYYDPHNCIHYNETPPTPVCRLQLRAQRLDVYPDSVELVWFNGDQRPMTTAFALAKVLQGQWLKSQDPKDLEKLQQLCMPSPVGPGTAGSGPPDYYQESYIYDPDL